MSEAPTRTPVVLVSGLSGAGKASILRALEDLGYEAVDNLPLEMMSELVSNPTPGRRIAIGVDCRSRGFDADAVLAALGTLRRNPALRVDLVFAWASDMVLLRRYTETRRRHPLSPQGRVADGVLAEQALTASLKEAADLVIDTSDLPLAGLRNQIERRYGRDMEDEPQVGLAVSLVSFAFPAGLPAEAELVFDARFLRNPHYDPELRPRTGKDPAVAAYVEADPDFSAFFDKMTGMLDLLLPRFVQEGKKYATIAVGCTGGRHRSVHIIEKLAAYLTKNGWRVSTTHREIARDLHSARDRTMTTASPYQSGVAEDQDAAEVGPTEKTIGPSSVQAREA